MKEIKIQGARLGVLVRRRVAPAQRPAGEVESFDLELQDPQGGYHNHQGLSGDDLRALADAAALAIGRAPAPGASAVLPPPALAPFALPMSVAALIARNAVLDGKLADYEIVWQKLAGDDAVLKHDDIEAKVTAFPGCGVTLKDPARALCDHDPDDGATAYLWTVQAGPASLEGIAATKAGACLAAADRVVKLLETRARDAKQRLGG